MKKIILIVAVILLSVAGAYILRNRLMAKGGTSTTDVTITNDTTDTISCEYKKDGKEVTPTLKPGEKVSGGKGFMRFFTAKRDGSYEIMYPFPRPSGAPMAVTFTQIMQAAQGGKFGETMYTEKGMIGDIKINYEEVRDVQE